MPISTLTCEKFLKRNRIDPEQWTAAHIEWEALRAIGEDFERRANDLGDVAALHARLLQRCPNVHSVRWRLKDAEHLLQKIIRKRAQGSEKYAAISAANYTAIVSDLVGLRALHLFKDDWRGVHMFLSEGWEHNEEPVAYVREGDDEEVRTGYVDAGCRVEVHPAGYRSVHYIVASHPQKDRVLAEIQVRTIFEEGWSEIDHRVRYPNFSDNELIGLFLATFNRIAGSADEMGSFVRTLAAGIDKYEDDVQRSRTEAQGHLAKIEQLVAELGAEKQRSANYGKQLQALGAAVAALKKNASVAAPPKPKAPPTMAQMLARLHGASGTSSPTSIDMFRAQERFLKFKQQLAQAPKAAPVGGSPATLRPAFIPPKARRLPRKPEPGSGA